MATELAKAYVQLFLLPKVSAKTSQTQLTVRAAMLEKRLAKNRRRLLSSLGKIVTVAAVGKIITNALKVGGELEQNLGGTEAVFGNFAKHTKRSFRCL